jgi:hypothetical protein
LILGQALRQRVGQSPGARRGYQVEPEVVRLVEQHGEAIAVIEWAVRLRVLGLDGEIGVIAPGRLAEINRNARPTSSEPEVSGWRSRSDT